MDATLKVVPILLKKTLCFYLQEHDIEVNSMSSNFNKGVFINWGTVLLHWQEKALFIFYVYADRIVPGSFHPDFI